MRYCPLCADADREKYGETYWHRKWQLPDIEICLEHRCRLETTDVGATAESQRFKLTPAEIVISYDTTVNMDISELEYRVSDYVLQIFEAKLEFENNVSIGEFLHSKLEGTPYTSLRGENVLVRKLHEALTVFYKDLQQNSLGMWWCIQKVFCAQNFHTFDICLIAMFLGIPVNELLHMELPELTLQQRFDNQLRLLRSQGMTQKQAAEVMGVSIHAIKGVEEKRFH